MIGPKKKTCLCEPATCLGKDGNVLANRSATCLQETISKAISAKRLAMGMSMQMLANRAGISKSMISRIESGERLGTRDLLDRIFAELDLIVSIR